MPMPPLELAGKSFGLLTAIAIVGKRDKCNVWRCVCVCGNETTATASQLTHGARRSCGCGKYASRAPRPDVAAKNRANAKHGLCDTPTYRSWQQMRKRCQNPDDKDYHNYGERGITVCDKWQEFLGFIGDMGMRPKGYTLGRIDNDGNYEPGNCRWETPVQQGRNKRVNVLVSFNGKSQCVAEWAEEVGLERKTLEYRIRIGWDASRALTTLSLIKRK